MRARAPALALATLLAACSTPSPRPPAGGTVARGEPSSRPPGARSGGYYLDDGPGENAPANLDAIPDAVPRAEPLIARANRPYTVFDRQYAPMTQLAPYRERGVASWYGRKYHGQRTSSGEVYDMYAMTAAHPTLPIPSYARVTNLRNGRAVVVRVNDRGPFLYGRVVDLSYTAAARLGYVAGGSADVEVELITRFDVPASPAAPAVGQVALGAPAAIGAGAASVAPVVASSSSAATAAAAIAGTSERTPIAAGASSASLVGGADAPAPERLDVETVVTPAPGSTPPASPAASPPSAPATSPSAVPAAGPSAAPAATTSSGPSARAAVPPAAGSVFLQLGAFTTRENAEASRARLARQLDWLAERIEVRSDGGMFKVQAGPYAQRDDALAAAERVRLQTGFKPFAVSR